jgi:hypothetical protein
MWARRHRDTREHLHDMHRRTRTDFDPMTSAAEHRIVITDGLPSQVPDMDPAETQEWVESLDEVVDHAGRPRARSLLLSVLERARVRHVGVPGLHGTDYLNTIPTASEPPFPGDEHIELRLRAYNRWNAAMMVHRAQRPGVGVGGHISTYASAAALYEVGFNHFFRGHDPGGQDHDAQHAGFRGSRTGAHRVRGGGLRASLRSPRLGADADPAVRPRRHR